MGVKQEPGRNTISTRDVAIVVLLAVLWPVSWLLPSVCWPALAALPGYLIVFLATRRTLKRARLIKEVTAATPLDVGPVSVQGAVLSGCMQQHLQYLREWRPGGWRPRITVKGLEHINAAREKGQGILLWTGPFLHTDLVVKKGLAESGLALAHLARKEHGFSPTTLGVRCLNHIKIAAEDRYLEERIFVHAGKEVAAVRRMERLLRKNQPVTVAANALGARVLDVPLLGGAMPIASGVPALALATGAALLPVFTLYRGPDRFDVIIEKPLAAQASTDRRRAVEEMAREFARIVESYMVEYPHLCYEWILMKAGRSSC